MSDHWIESHIMRTRSMRVAEFIAFVLPLSVPFAAAAEQSGNHAESAGIATRYTSDQGIEKDPDVIFASGFENGIQEPLKISRKGVVALEDSKVAYSGQSCIQITATKDVDEGGDLKLRWAKGVDQCYLRVYVRFDKDTLMPHHFINLAGHTPTYRFRWGGGAGLRPSGGRDGGFSATLEPPKNDSSKWKFYSYWHEMRSWQTPRGASDGRPNAYYGNGFAMQDFPRLPRDKWICLEFMIKLNDIGKHNGEQAYWLDGQLIGHWKQGSPNGTWMRENFRTFGQFNSDPKPFEGFSWRTDESLQVNKADLQWYLSRNQSWKKMTSKENIVYFDNLVIAKSYIGPMKISQ